MTTLGSRSPPVVLTATAISPRFGSRHVTWNDTGAIVAAVESVTTTCSVLLPAEQRLMSPFSVTL